MVPPAINVPGLAKVFFSSGYVVGPPDDAADDRTVVPTDVGDRWLAPRESRIFVGADQRNVLRDP